MLTINAGRGGVVIVIWQMAGGLVEKGHDVAVMCDAGTELARLKEMGVKHFPIAFSNAQRDLWAGRRALRAAFAEFRPDVVHSHSRWPSLVSMSLGRRPDISTLHAQRLTPHGSVLDRGVFRRLIGGWGRHITVLGEPIKRMLADETGLPEDRIVVIPNSVDETRFVPPSVDARARARAMFGFSEEDVVALFVGALLDVKRPWWCVEALAAARARGIPARMLIVGEGQKRRDCEQMAGERGILEHCVFAGWREDTLPAYHSADLLMLPSEEEGFALVCVEAMLCGVPVLRTRTGGAEQQVVEAVTGWSTQPEDKEAFLAAAISAMSDRAKLRLCGLAAREHALARFTRARTLGQIERLYHEALETRARPRAQGVSEHR